MINDSDVFRVGIAGLGGIGSQVAQILVRSYIRSLFLVDFDRVEQSCKMSAGQDKPAQHHDQDHDPTDNQKHGRKPALSVTTTSVPDKGQRSHGRRASWTFLELLARSRLRGCYSLLKDA